MLLGTEKAPSFSAPRPVTVSTEPVTSLRSPRRFREPRTRSPFASLFACHGSDGRDRLCTSSSRSVGPLVVSEVDPFLWEFANAGGFRGEPTLFVGSLDPFLWESTGGFFRRPCRHEFDTRGGGCCTPPADERPTSPTTSCYVRKCWDNITNEPLNRSVRSRTEEDSKRRKILAGRHDRGNLSTIRIFRSFLRNA